MVSAGHDGSYAVRSEDAAAADIVVAQRWDSPGGLGTWRRMKAFSRLVYEVDDDVFSIEPQNWSAYQVYSRADVQDAVAHSAEVADLVTVSTPPLAEVMRRFNPNVVVLPNLLPDWMLDLDPPCGERPAVGWMGGASHALDIMVVAGPLRRFLRRNPGWDAVLIGTDYRNVIKHERCGFIPWTHIGDDAAAYFRSLDYDIALAPLLDSPFNRSKSALKALENSGRGIPVIASDVEPYRRFIIHGETGYLVRYEHEWIKYMEELAGDQALRESMGARAKQVAREHVISRGWQRWQTAYEELLT